MNRRQTQGTETVTRLREWVKGQPASERLAAHLLRADGYTALDPSHPLGGKDGLRDVVCQRAGERWIGAAYFPRGQQSLGAIKEKFINDLAGVALNAAVGIAFVTNQELRLGERAELVELAGSIPVDLFHLERIASILDSPSCYGIRLDFLDIEMNREEQIAFFADRNRALEGVQQSLELLASKIQEIAQRGTSDGGDVSVPLADIKEFKSILDAIAGANPSFDYLSTNIFATRPGHMRGLRVPLEEMRQFAELVDRLTGSPGLSAAMSLSAYSLGPIPGHVSRLKVPLSEIQEYEATLDRIIAKLPLLTFNKPRSP